MDQCLFACLFKKMLCVSDLPLPSTMTQRFELDFDQDWIKGLGLGIERSVTTKKCFEFKLDGQEFNPSSSALAS